MTDDQRFALNSTRFASVLFEEKHNPFAAYQEDIPRDSKRGEIPMDQDLLRDAVPLKDLIESLEKEGAKVPVTYNVDALTTLCNLQLYDAMTNADREKNGYNVTYEFVKKNDDGTFVRLPASALAEQGAKKLADDDYQCFVTGIRAEFKKSGSFNTYGPGSKFRISDRAMIPLEMVTRLAGFSDDYVEKELFAEYIDDRNRREEAKKNGSKGYGHDALRADPPDRLVQAFKELKIQLLMRTDEKMLGTSAGEWRKFNVISTRALKRDMVSNNIDFRPVRPSARLKKKTYHRSALAEDRLGGRYFDARLMADLDMNTLTDNGTPHDFDEKLNDKLLSEKSLTLSDASLRSDALKGFLEKPGDDPQLQNVAVLMKEVFSMGKDDVTYYDYKILTGNGEAEDYPENGDEYILTEAGENRYDIKARELYKAIGAYAKAHKDDLKDPGSLASVLDQWKNKAYPKGSPAFNEKDPNCVIVNAASKTQGDDLLTFDGDGDYLCGAELSFKTSDYWDCEDDSVHAMYGTDNREFYMKDFRDAPLFTREPSVSDIKQGEIGNCYFLAYITSAIAMDPSAIKNMIRDNDDGTVTCRFFNNNSQPVYVTIEKTVPYVRFPDGDDPSKDGEIFEIPCSNEKAPLWFHLLQKGYVLSGVRKMDDVAVKLRAEAEEKFKDNSAEEAGTDVRTRILNVRFRKEESKDELVANATDKLYGRIIDHTTLVMDGGLSGNVHKHFTGTKSRERELPALTGRETIAALRSMDLDSNCFCGDRLLKKNLSENDQKILKDVLKKAADRLTLEKTRYSVDPDGREFVSAERINMDELLDAVAAVAEDPALSPAEAPERSRLCAVFSDAMTDYQMNEPRPEKVFVSLRTEKYSAYANTTFNVLKAHLKKDHGAACSFNALGEAQRDDLQLPGRNEFISTGGNVTHHAFTILDCREENGRKTVYVRNPWGASGRQKNVASMISSEGKEELTYATIGSAPDEKDHQGGVFRMDLNEFVEFAKDISFLPREPSLKYDEVVSSLAARYLKVIESQNADKYKVMVDTYGYDKILEKMKTSDLILEYADEVFEIDDVAKDAEDGKKVDKVELRRVEKFREELNSVFAAAPAKVVSPPEKDQGKRDAEASEISRKGGAKI